MVCTLPWYVLECMFYLGPEIPGNFTAIATERSVRLSWEKAVGLFTYTIYWCKRSLQEGCEVSNIFALSC